MSRTAPIKKKFIQYAVISTKHGGQVLSVDCSEKAAISRWADQCWWGDLDTISNKAVRYSLSEEEAKFCWQQQSKVQGLVVVPVEIGVPNIHDKYFPPEKSGRCAVDVGKITIYQCGSPGTVDYHGVKVCKKHARYKTPLNLVS